MLRMNQPYVTSEVLCCGVPCGGQWSRSASSGDWRPGNLVYEKAFKLELPFDCSNPKMVKSAYQRTQPYGITVR